MFASKCLLSWIAAVGVLAVTTMSYAQAPHTNTNPDVLNVPIGTTPLINRNTFQAGRAVCEPNKIVQPIPLNATEREAALTSIDKHIMDETMQIKTKLKSILPDELNVLAKTVGWTQERQNALLIALRACDPAAVYEAWTQGNPQDTAGAEIVARQTEVKRILGRLEQDAHSHAAVGSDLMELETALTKISNSTTGVNEAVAGLAALKTWSEVRKMVDAVVPDNGLTAKLPAGKVALIYDPSLAVGRAIVLGNDAVMIGNEGRGAIMIRQGIAAEALGLPIVTAQAVRDAQGTPVSSGVLLVNPPNSRGMITYNADGYQYKMEPGMTQELPLANAATTWNVSYDRGGGFGPDSYVVGQGTYYFTPTDTGWQLYKQRFDVVLDNSQSSQEFNFLFDGQKMTVPANGSRMISSIYPMVISYDRCNGTELVSKVLNFSGNVQVGVNVADNRWDIFPTSNNQRSVSNLKLFE